jgi:hypothetical protein
LQTSEASIAPEVFCCDALVTRAEEFQILGLRSYIEEQCLTTKGTKDHKGRTSPRGKQLCSNSSPK